MKKLTVAHLIYFAAFCALGIYGYKITPFAPTEQVKETALHLSYVYFAYFTAICLLLSIKTRAKAFQTIESLSNTIKFYAKVFIALPITIGLFGFLHYYAIAYGLTSIHAEVFADNRSVSVSITNKFEKSGKSSVFGVYISGIEHGFKVDQDYYKPSIKVIGIRLC